MGVDINTLKQRARSAKSSWAALIVNSPDVECDEIRTFVSNNERTGSRPTRPTASWRLDGTRNTFSTSPEGQGVGIRHNRYLYRRGEPAPDRGGTEAQERISRVAWRTSARELPI
jgi:hypothetical protein